MVGCKKQGVIISELSLLRSRKRFFGVVEVRDRKMLIVEAGPSFVGTEHCLKCPGPSFGTECCLITEAGTSLGIGTDNHLKAKPLLVSDVKGFM
jgi:hypothetical protein